MGVEPWAMTGHTALRVGVALLVTLATLVPPAATPQPAVGVLRQHGQGVVHPFFLPIAFAAVAAPSPGAQDGSELLAYFRALAKDTGHDEEGMLALPGATYAPAESWLMAKLNNSETFTNESAIPQSIVFNEASELLLALYGVTDTEPSPRCYSTSADNEVVRNSLLQTDLMMEELPDQPLLHGIPEDVVGRLAALSCTFVQKAEEFTELAAEMNNVQHASLRALAQQTRDAPTTWAGMTEFYGDQCQKPPFCLEAIARATPSYHNFYFPIKYMLFWDLAQPTWADWCSVRVQMSPIHLGTFPADLPMSLARLCHRKR